MADSSRRFRVGDLILAKVKIKRKTQKVSAHIKWIGEGKFLPGPGTYCRIDIDGKRHFIEKEAILENFGRTVDTDVVPLKKAKKKRDKEKPTMIFFHSQGHQPSN